MKKEASNIEELIEQIKEERLLLTEDRIARKRKESASKQRAYRKQGVGRAKVKYWLTDAFRASHNKFIKREQATVGGAYRLLVRAYRHTNKRRLERGGKPVEFLLSLEDWKRLWSNAPLILHRGVRKAAFYGRGRKPEDVQLMRIDEDKPFTLDNCVIMWQGNVLVNGRKL